MGLFLSSPICDTETRGHPGASPAPFHPGPRSGWWGAPQAPSTCWELGLRVGWTSSFTQLPQALGGDRSEWGAWEPCQGSSRAGGQGPLHIVQLGPAGQGASSHEGLDKAGLAQLRTESCRARGQGRKQPRRAAEEPPGGRPCLVLGRTGAEAAEKAMLRGWREPRPIVHAGKAGPEPLGHRVLGRRPGQGQLSCPHSGNPYPVRPKGHLLWESRREDRAGQDPKEPQEKPHVPRMLVRQLGPTAATSLPSTSAQCLHMGLLLQTPPAPPLQAETKLISGSQPGTPG